MRHAPAFGVISLENDVFEYLKKNVGLVFLALVTNLAAVSVWKVYLTYGYVYVSKFGIKFYGNAALVQSLAVLFAALICDYYFFKSLRLHRHQ